MDWRLGIRYEVLPGEGVVDRFANANRFGFDVVELPGRYLSKYRQELLDHTNELALPISSISLGFRGSLISSDPEVRRICRDDIKDLVLLCSSLGASGLVMPPVLHMDACPRVTTTDKVADRRREDELLVESLPELASFATEHGVHLMLEPVNAFETDYMTTVEHAARICDTVGHEGLGITIDFFHMQMSELNPVSAIGCASRWIRHVHVAENTRVEPGPGVLDFRPGFKALQEIGYDGCIVVECRDLSGPPDQVLPSSARYLRELFP